jgi:hypothetical protein
MVVMSKRVENSGNATHAVKLLRKTISIPATDLARRMKDQTFALADYNRVARLVGPCSYRELLGIIQQHDCKRPRIAA